VELVKTQTGNQAVSSLLADLSSIREVRRLAQEFKEKYQTLDVLLNNAGAFYLSRKASVDGYEMTLALNHLNYFLLTGLLVDRAVNPWAKTATLPWLEGLGLGGPAAGVSLVLLVTGLLVLLSAGLALGRRPIRTLEEDLPDYPGGELSGVGRPWWPIRSA
jgi:NAD(P)-dependent dehydrogenase (short-subunit alcohol dehydrogenase family)